MSKVLTEYEAVRYAIILELIMEKKYGTYAQLFLAYKNKKEEKPILMVMYDAMVYEETNGIESLDNWYYTHPECHARVEDYLNRVSAQSGNVVLQHQTFPLIYSYKFLQNHLPETNLLVKHTRSMYDRLQRLSNKIRFPKGTKADRQPDPLLAKDGFPTWDDWLAFELDRIMNKAD